jgi:hypothetical protein
MTLHHCDMYNKISTIQALVDQSLTMLQLEKLYFSRNYNGHLILVWYK